jgi:hypothetical protein
MEKLDHPSKKMYSDFLKFNPDPKANVSMPDMTEYVTRKYIDSGLIPDWRGIVGSLKSDKSIPWIREEKLLDSTYRGFKIIPLLMFQSILENGVFRGYNYMFHDPYYVSVLPTHKYTMKINKPRYQELIGNPLYGIDCLSAFAARDDIAPGTYIETNSETYYLATYVQLPNSKFVVRDGLFFSINISEYISCLNYSKGILKDSFDQTKALSIYDDQGWLLLDIRNDYEYVRYVECSRNRILSKGTRLYLENDIFLEYYRRGSNTTQMYNLLDKGKYQLWFFEGKINRLSTQSIENPTPQINGSYIKFEVSKNQFDMVCVNSEGLKDAPQLQILYTVNKQDKAAKLSVKDQLIKYYSNNIEVTRNQYLSKFKQRYYSPLPDVFPDDVKGIIVSYSDSPEVICKMFIDDIVLHGFQPVSSQVDDSFLYSLKQFNDLAGLFSELLD